MWKFAVNHEGPKDFSWFENRKIIICLVLEWRRPAGAASHLEHRHVVLPVDLVGGRVEPAALLHVLVEDAAALHVAEAELAQVELRQSGGREAGQGGCQGGGGGDDGGRA